MMFCIILHCFLSLNHKALVDFWRFLFYKFNYLFMMAVMFGWLLFLWFQANFSYIVHTKFTNLVWQQLWLFGNSNVKMLGGCKESSSILFYINVWKLSRLEASKEFRQQVNPILALNMATVASSYWTDD